MDTTGEAAVLFQIRWVPDDNDDDDDDDNEDDEDDNKSSQFDNPPSGFDVPISGLQGSDTDSNLGGLTESVRSEDFHSNQRGTQIESSQQLAHEPMCASSDPELIESLVEPMNNGLIAYLKQKYISEPWNPLVSFVKRRATAPAQTMYYKFWYAGFRLDTSSTYHTATSFIYHSATSGIGGHGNSITEASSE
jgi:hypothetical protein